MSVRLIRDLSLNRVGSALGEIEGYDLWFDLPPKTGDATTPELQMLCQSAILVGRIAQAMAWNWPALIRNVSHVSAPFEEYVLVEVGTRLFHSPRFRRALQSAVPASGLDPYKVKIMDAENANAYILGHGLPPF